MMRKLYFSKAVKKMTGLKPKVSVLSIQVNGFSSPCKRKGFPVCFRNEVSEVFCMRRTPLQQTVQGW